MTPTTKPTTTGAPEQAGAAMDRLVAEKVMGWRLNESGFWAGSPNHLMHYPPQPQYAMCDNRYWKPFTKIQDAMQVAQRMKFLGFAFGCWDVSPVSSVMRGPRAAFVRSVHPPKVDDSVGGRTLAEAICRAALAALAATATGAGETK